MPIRITGLSSGGLDTDAIISQLMKAQRTKIDTVQKQKTKTEWKADAWSSLNTKIYSLYTGSLNTMRFTDGYNKKTTTISDTSVATISADSTAVNGTQELAIKQLAKTGYLTGGTISTSDSSTLSANSTLSQLSGFSATGSGNIQVTTGSGTSTSVTVSGSSKISDVISQLKSAGVNASFDATNKRIFVSSKSSGEAGDFMLTAGDKNGVNYLSALGLNASSTAVNDEYTKWEKYVGYTNDPAGTGTYQAQYNTEFDLLKASTKSTLEAEKATAETNLDTILKKYNSNYVSTNRQKEYDDLVGQKPALTTQKTDLDGYITTDNKDIADAKAIIDDPTTNPADKAAATTKLNTATAKLKTDSTTLTATVSKLTDIDSVTSYYNTIAAKTTAMQDPALSTTVQTKMQDKAKAAEEALKVGYSSGAVKVTGQDAKITLNGADFTSTSNSFSINGLNITAKGLTPTSKNALGDTVYNTVSITTSGDNKAIYDSIKKFFKEYNSVINEMDSLYGAKSAKGYEPLTDDEKESMTDAQIEKWESKVKDALLRRDSTLGDVSSSMKTAMAETYEINGTKYSLASFGISTGSYFTTKDNEHNSYHIDGDTDDLTTSTNKDKLMTAISSDPNTVVSFFTSLSKGLYDDLFNKMKSVDGVKSAYKVYEDKTMASDIEDYDDKIDDMEDKFTAMEDKYYKQFSAMETALSKLQSSSSSLSSLLGG